MVWALVIFLTLMLGGTSFLLWRATSRLLEFDELLRTIVDPMQEYAEELRKIATAEGILHDHPEVIAFHRANMKMLRSIDAAIVSLRETQPQSEPKGLPPQAG